MFEASLLRSRWVRGALMPLPVAGLCPEPGSILIRTQRDESDAPFLPLFVFAFPRNVASGTIRPDLLPAYLLPWWVYDPFLGHELEHQRERKSEKATVGDFRSVGPSAVPTHKLPYLVMSNHARIRGL